MLMKVLDRTKCPARVEATSVSFGNWIYSKEATSMSFGNWVFCFVLFLPVSVYCARVLDPGSKAER